MEAFIDAMTAVLGREQVITDYALRYALGTDASFYRLTPQCVVLVKSAEQVQKVVVSAAENRLAITFRAAGTSLSGQAISDSVLVLLSDDWQDYKVAEDGSWISLSPSLIGARVNRILAPYGRKIGPDPASINSCKIGGIAANNASGMCCGVKHNSYHTLKDMAIIFADGSYLDTADKNSKAAFRQSHKDLLTALEQLAQRVRENEALSTRIAHKYRLKNTTGYGLNALVDHHDGIEIIKHLMIGSEGTLGFIANITYNTVVEPAFKRTGLFTFADVDSACVLIEQLSALPIAAVEMLDKRALLSVQQHAVMPQNVADFPSEATALLIEISGENQQALDELDNAVNAILAQYQSQLVHHYPLSDDIELAQALWNVRKGTFPAVGAVRETGTTVIIEDVAFALADLSRGIKALHQLFDKHGYSEAIIFGHALAGNLHFVFTQAFDSPEQLQRYDEFMADVAHLVAVELKGSLKAEHGTGRNMAPFVALEWGDEGYAVMQQIKQLFDKQGILNPGVIINGDPRAHLQHVKTMPASDIQIDKCIECGFCEPVCPSKEYTLTPRQRISLKRHEQQLLDERPTHPDAVGRLFAVQQGYQHLAIDSCAATGLCATRCPVGIDTGAYIKSLRVKQMNAKPVITKIANWTANHFAMTSALARVGVRGAHLSARLLGAQRLEGFSAQLQRRFGTPLYYSAWPEAQHTEQRRVKVNGGEARDKVVYVPSCANRIFANAAEPSIQQRLQRLCDKAGLSLVIPEEVTELCCGMPWQSRGLSEVAMQKQQQLQQTIARLSEGGRWPVVIDASPCALQSQPQELGGARVLDSMGFACEYLLPRLAIEPSSEPLWLHITCSSQHLDGGVAMLTLARALSSKVSTTEVSCCGFAGDKGFTHPQLNEHALRHVSANKPKGCSVGYSNSRTCEIGLTRHSGVIFSSLLALLDERAAALAS
ncbi:FAD-binding and (Fe-S)-binding domain-containing protein [Pseudoalteromonas sp. BDTF-M6]|uniref:FAD-binding and (Fe-S)-binding domain-containing protein n=1 Tax=Pseudoalteromonas sp. BDTF-M6 TaxID=2796132 RepID=UPI001BAF710B|nr:FAD-binding and (Fe-S)-binding domain-containing protein [Pseudoalteromonas sp. BDTF-M6]MBS3797982.1 FAD-binding oxidoreductase [Pseudoalteromonas sp. BDTF-M6]